MYFNNKKKRTGFFTTCSHCSHLFDQIHFSKHNSEQQHSSSCVIHLLKLLYILAPIITIQKIAFNEMCLSWLRLSKFKLCRRFECEKCSGAVRRFCYFRCKAMDPCSTKIGLWKASIILAIMLHFFSNCPKSLSHNHSCLCHVKNNAQIAVFCHTVSN